MALWGDAPRFGKGTGGTLLGGEVFVDVLSQTQSSVGPGSYNINAKVSKVGVPKLTPQMSMPKTPRRWNQPQLHSQESRLMASATASSHLPSNRHSYLYSTMSHGVEIYRSDVGLIPGPGAYGGKIVGDWDEPRRKAKADAAAAIERGRAPSPSKHFTVAKRPDPTVLATAVVRDDILIVHKTAAVPGPGMYGRLYDRRSPWITRSFNVRVRTGNSPVRPRPTSCMSPSSSPAAHVPRGGSNNQQANSNNRRSATPQPVRSAWASPRRDEAGAVTQAASSMRGQTARSLATQSINSEYPAQRTRDRRQSTRAQELESWWEQVMTRTHSPRHSTLRSPRLA